MQTRRTPAPARRGSALVAITAVLTTLAMLSLALLATTGSANREQVSAAKTLTAQYVAEAGLATAMVQIQRGDSGAVGSADEPLAFGTSSLWVEEVDLGGGNTSLVASGVSGATGASAELVVQKVASSIYSYAAFGDETTRIESNAHVDSYDATLGTYESQATGTGNDAFANDDGTVGSNGNIEVLQNGEVHGGAHAGPGRTTSVLGNAIVTGATTPSPSSVALPPIEVPAIATTGALVVGGNSSHTLAAGSHHFSELLVGTNARLAVRGPATIVFDSFEMRSNSELIVDATNGPVEFFVLGDFILNSNTLIQSVTSQPADVSFKLLSDNVIDPDLDVDVDLDIVDFESNSKLYGTIYAPHAAIEINSNFELFGSLVARSVLLDSWARVHYDESLTTSTEETTYTYQVLCWRPVPFRGYP